MDYPWTGFELTTLVMTGTDTTASFKSNYHTIRLRPRRPLPTFDCKNKGDYQYIYINYYGLLFNVQLY
jgi:hypothetical protein